MEVSPYTLNLNFIKDIDPGRMANSTHQENRGFPYSLDQFLSGEIHLS